jgi:hypothetical protein
MTTKRTCSAIHDAHGAHGAHQNVQPTLEMYRFASESQGCIWVFRLVLKRPDRVSERWFRCPVTRKPDTLPRLELSFPPEGTAEEAPETLPPPGKGLCRRMP